MPVLVVCPECGATTTTDGAGPKTGTIPCRQCGIQVPIPEPKPAAPPPLPPKPATPVADAPTAAASPAPKPLGPPPIPAAKADTGFEVLDDEDEMDDAGRPAVGRKSRDDDEDDDRPRSGRRDRDDDDEDDRRPTRSRSRDEEDDEDEAPRRPAARSRDDDEDEDEAPRRPAARSRDDDEDEDEAPRRPTARGRDDDEDEDEAPRRPTARGRDNDEDEDEAPRRPAARGRDDDEDEDEAPRRPAARAVVDEDGQVIVRGRQLDDDEDDDRPRRRDRDEPKSKRGLLLVVGLFVFLVLGAGVAIAAWYLWFQDPATTVATNNPPPDDPGDKPGVQDPVVPKGKGPDAKVPDTKVPAVWKAPDRELAIQPVRFDGPKKTVTLPGTVTDVCAGGDGRYLFLHCAEERKLLVFDVSSAEVVKDFPTGGKDARFAAGATKLLLFDGTVRTIQLFDLVKLEKDKEVPLPVPGVIRDIALGSGSRGPALVMTDTPGDTWPIFFLDLETLAPADVGWAAAPPTDLPRDVRFRASANGSRWIGLPEGKDAKGAVLVARDGKAITATKIAPDKSLGFATLSGDGATLYSRLGSFPIRMAPPAGPPMNPDSYHLPGVTAAFDIFVQPGEQPDTVNVTLNNLRIKGKGPVPKMIKEVPQPFKPDEPALPDRLVHYVPDAHALFVINPVRKRLEVVKLDPFAPPPLKTATVTSTPPDSFSPGKPFEYPVRVLTNGSQVTFAVGGPTGVTVTPEGTIRWTPPGDEMRDQLQLLVTVRADNSSGTQPVRLFNTSLPAPKAAGPKTEPKKEPMPKSPDPKVPVIAAGAKLVQPAKEKVPITPAEMTAAKVEVPLPGQARDVCIGGGGRYLIFHVPTARKLVVFDTSTLKVAKTLTLPTDDLMFSAGMDKLLIVYPAAKTIVRYSLPALKLEGDTTFDARQKPTFAAMGSGTAGPLILGGVPSQNNASRMALTFLDVESFNEVKIDKADGDFSVTTATAASLRVSADGRTLGLWRTELVPSGVQIARLEGNTIKGAYKADAAGEVTPGPDGQKVYTEQGIFDLDATPGDSRTPVVPAVQGAGYLTVTRPAAGKRSVAVWGAATDKPLATFDDLPGFDGKKDPFERDNPNLALDHRLFLVPDAGVLIVVAPTADKLHVYRLGDGKK